MIIQENHAADRATFIISYRKGLCYNMVNKWSEYEI